jgi:hypothetical protein
MIKRFKILKTGFMILTALAFQKSVAQVKIGQRPKTLEPAAILELESPEKGLLLTRISDTMLINQLNPPDGMLIYYTGNGQQNLMVRKQHQWTSLITVDSLSKYIKKTVNGLTSSEDRIFLGGELIEPTILYTSAINTFSLKGLPEGNGRDSVLVSETNTGIVKKIASNSLTIKVAKLSWKAKEGQLRFATPKPVTDPDRITVFRNGILIGFTVVDENTIELEQGINCNMNDEIQIVQYYY